MPSGEAVTEIYFYGAGVSSEKNQATIKQAFLEFFPQAEIEIGWDLLAAARALCGNEPGIACIMGTGSNSCLYDGKNITDNVAKAITWVRNPEPVSPVSDLLLRQVAALGALVTAIRQQASTLDAEGRAAIDAVVAANEKLAEVVQRHLDGPDVPQD